MSADLLVLQGLKRVRAARSFRAARAAVEPKARGPQALASGLVNSSTSDTSPVVDFASQDVFTVDRDAGRLKKMRARVLEAASVHTDGTKLRPAMVTVTYAKPGEWNPRHLSAALKCVRQWMNRRGHRMRYVWTAELQERGVIHYHVITWFPEGQDKPPFWDEQGWWKHGSTRSEWADNGVGYIAKYVSKIGSKDRLPAGARMHGSGGFTPDERKRMTWHSRPGWLRQLTSALQTVRRRKGGGWVQQFACGLRRALHSPYIVLTVNPLRIARRDTGTGRLAAALIELRNDHVPTAYCVG